MTTIARIVLLIALSIWGFRLFNRSYQNIYAYDSFMHLMLLPFHEAGHFLFIPLGEFMTVLGGSLFQIGLPIGIGFAFLLRQNDQFGAAICLWWAGASLIDLAPYIWDSINPQLMLLSGMTGDNGGHDWIYLLRRFGALEYAHTLGSLVHNLGGVIMVLGLVWGSKVLVSDQNSRRETA